MKYFDTHAHPDHPLVEDKEAYITEMKEAGIDRLVIAPITYESNFSSMGLFSECDYTEIYYAKGLHPKCAMTKAWWTKEEKDKFIGLLQEKRVVAIKSGLDFIKKKMTYQQKERQKEYLKQFLELANNYQKPLVLHVREATEEMLLLLKENPLQVPAEIHCFTLGKHEMEEFLAAGITHFGIGGMVTRLENTNLRESVREMPLECILLESDAPFVKIEGEAARINTSGKAIPKVVREIASLKGLSEEEVAEKTYQNACLFFGIAE